MSALHPVILSGVHVILEPLAVGHGAELLDAGSDPAVWRYLTVAQPRSLAEMEALIAAALRGRDGGAELPFAVRSRAAGRAVGSTRYLDWRPADSAVEIGWTWIGSPWQRSAVNTEAKYLLLRHAFETLGCVRVQFKTDGRNLQSQRALERLGALREGVLRKHRRLWDGYLRDSVYFSVLDAEWPRVQQRLQEFLRR